jgi:hypothetical protein
VPQSHHHGDALGAGVTITGIDFGFNFDTVVNTRDFAACGADQFELSLPGLCAAVRHQLRRARRRRLAGPVGQRPDRWRDHVPAERIRVEHFHDSVDGAHGRRRGGHTRRGAACGVWTSTRFDATTQTVNIGNTNGGTLGTGGTVGVDAITLPTFRGPKCSSRPGTPS